MKKTVIFFDFFGVISSEIAPIWFGKYFPPEQVAQIKHDAVGGADLGEITEEQMFSSISQLMCIPAEDIRREWYEMAIINLPLVEYIKEIKKYYPVYLLSNAIDSFLDTILQKNGLYELFDRIFISSELHLAKPDIAFYEKVLEEIKIDSKSAVMIDDNPANIAGAEQAGIAGILFEDNEQLKKILATYFDKLA